MPERMIELRERRAAVDAEFEIASSNLVGLEELGGEIRHLLGAEVLRADRRVAQHEVLENISRERGQEASQGTRQSRCQRPPLSH